MLLAVDVGNSNTSLGLFEGSQLRAEFRISTRRGWTRDEIAVDLRQTLALGGVDFEDVDAAVLACVVPPVQGLLVDALAEYMKVQALVVGPGTKTGMPVRYENPHEVGADRVVAAVAAHHRYGRGKLDDQGRPPAGELGVIVVDFGTATTFDVVSPKPEYLGGVIAPGIGISADALFARAAKLPRVDIIRPKRVIGRNTVAAIQSGLLFGYVGLVEGMLRRVMAELSWEATVVATGGLANLVAAETDAIDFVDDSLMLEGLRIIHERNL
jgi:type III pantothenate kinase